MTTAIKIINAHWMRIDSYSRFWEIKACKNALKIPSDDGSAELSLLQHYDFPNRLKSRVFKAIKNQSEDPNHQIDINWECNKPLVLGDISYIVYQCPEMVKSFNLRGSYQLEGIKSLLKHMGGILNSAAGSGKTRMAAYTLRLFFEVWQQKQQQSQIKNPPVILWLAQTREQVSQAEEALRFAGFSMAARWIEVSCWQAVNKSEKLQRLVNTCDVLVIDECHSASDSLYKIASNAHNAWWRIGLTATAVRTDNRELLLEAMFGQKVAVIDQRRVQSEGHLLKGHAIIYRVGANNDLKRKIEEAAEPELLKLNLKRCSEEFRKKETNRIIYRHAKRLGIVENERRNELICSVTHDFLDQGKIVLIIVATKKQGRWLNDRIANSQLVYSNMKVSEGRRDEIMQRAREGQIQCMIATSLADQGLDIPCLDVIVMAAGGKGGKDGYLVEQRAARGQRVSNGKEKGLVVDFEDNGESHLKFHSYNRITKYKQMGFKTEIKSLEVPA